MTSTEALARSNKPHSVAILNERLDAVLVKFRQELTEMVDQLNEADLSRTALESLTGSLRRATAEAGKSAFVALVESRDTMSSVVEHEGHPCRFKEVAEKQWCTPFGRAPIRRRTFAADKAPTRVAPLDHVWGMADRYLTPEVEEMVAFASGLVTPSEAEQLLRKTLPEAPSATAIKRAIRDVGDFIEERRDQIETRIEDERPLAAGDNLVVSWDGAMVPLRGGSSGAEWREAGIARISTYDEPRTSGKRPEMRDSRYLAQMPESKMTTLVGEIATQVAGLREERDFEHVAVICDGKDSIWREVSRPAFAGAVLILDFYHAAEHLSGAAKAIFGRDEARASRWFDKRRHELRHFRGAIGRIIRALRRYLNQLNAKSERYETVRRAIGYFVKNRRRMRYREFVDMGLPIGSGHVESAAKNIIGQRLKRSGMRWSRDGGQRVLNLRTLIKDERWPSAWAEYRDRAAA